MRMFYRIAKERHSKGHVFRGGGRRPLQDRFPQVEDILERRRPKDKEDRGNSIYLKEDKDFSRVGATYVEGYTHTVDPAADVQRRDLVWTGILQKRYFPDERFRKDLRPDLTDDAIADKWWAGEESDAPNWEWVTSEAIVLDVDDDPVRVRPKASLLNAFDKDKA